MAKTNIKVGDIVQVYQRPITVEDFEGKAEVRRIVSVDVFSKEEQVVRCMVNFPEDSPSTVVERRIIERRPT